MLYALYRAATDAAGPLVPLILGHRQRRGKEDPERRGERFGQPGCNRPQGPLVWIHAASVGEALSAGPLMRRLVDANEELSVLLTTGTVTSARLMSGRLPARTVHQYLPLDRQAYVTTFLDYWQPEAVLWMESELWPNMLSAINRRGIPAALINARLSTSSYRRWRYARGLFRDLLACFQVICPASGIDAERLGTLGVRVLGPSGNIKFSAPPPGAEAALVETLSRSIGKRPVWLAASTHEGEDALVAEVHHKLSIELPQVLTIIAPRHPTRGDAIMELLAQRGHSIARRSRGELPTAGHSVYLADTLGDMGLLLRVAPVTFVGGSLVPIGGHNPVEPALLGSAVLVGPHTANFSDVTRSLEEAGGLCRVPDADSLARTVLALLQDSVARKDTADRARAVAVAHQATLDRVMTAIAPLIRPSTPRQSASRVS